MVAGSKAAKTKCQRGINAIKLLITRMGLQINTQKDEFGQDMCMLGILLSTTANKENSCSAALTSKRRNYVDTRCMEMQHWKGSIRVHALMAFGGLLIFCSQVTPHSRLYLRSIYTIIGSHDKRSMVHLSQQFRQDCSWWKRLVLQSGPCGMLLDRRIISDSFLAWDASKTWGMGGFCAQNHQHFSIPWAAFEQGDLICDLAPVRNTPSWHINYMELYAGFTAIRRWGSLLRGYTVVCFTDSSSVHTWLT